MKEAHFSPPDMQVNCVLVCTVEESKIYQLKYLQPAFKCKCCSHLIVAELHGLLPT